MTQITDNQAAWQPFEKSSYYKVGPAPAPIPTENEVVIKVAYAAVNPTDWKSQDAPYFEFKYPFIFGTDVAGTIVQLGSEVTRFKIGQRVIGHCDSLFTHKPSNAGFQRYTACREILVSAIPDTLPLANAAVLPLGFSTAATGLYKNLKLPLPSLNPTPTGKIVLLWGGSSSVGSCAIQLAVASGLTVATTAGTGNHDYVKGLGATYAFDYKNSNVIQQILEVLKPGDSVFDCIGDKDCQVACAEIVSKLGGGKFATSLWPVPTEFENAKGELVIGLDPGFENPEIGDAVWRKYLPDALVAGKFQAKPDPLILEGGLEKVQEGVNILRKGVSAKKVVIEIAKPA